jgi:hypothetical protein
VFIQRHQLDPFYFLQAAQGFNRFAYECIAIGENSSPDGNIGSTLHHSGAAPSSGFQRSGPTLIAITMILNDSRLTIPG